MTRLSTSAAPNDEAMTWTNNEATTIINLEGRYVLPGLIDCHVHLSTPPGEEGLSATMNVDSDTSLIRQAYLAHEILKRGFTTVPIGKRRPFKSCQKLTTADPRLRRSGIGNEGSFG